MMKIHNKKILNEKTIAVTITIIGTVISLIFNVSNYENFLYSIGIVFAPSFAILLTDYYMMKQNIEAQKNTHPNILAFILCIFGMFMYYLFIKINFVFGATVPSMIIISIIYLIVKKKLKI